MAGGAALALLLGVAALSGRGAHAARGGKVVEEAAAAAFQPETVDEEGYRYGGSYVQDYYSAQPLKGKYMQFAYATCPSPYDSFSFVTQIRVCKDKHGFITGLKYFSEHPLRHHDPTTVCDVVGHEGACECETLKLYDEDSKMRRFRTVTNVRVAKIKDSGDRWRIVYVAFSYSDGAAVEFGEYPRQSGAKIEQWYQKPTPGMICGLNGFYSMGTVCDGRSGYLQWIKPCGKCIPKPRNYKCESRYDYCEKQIKRAYRGNPGYDYLHDRDGDGKPDSEQPGYQTPGYQAPGYRAPGYQAPGHQAPGYEQQPPKHEYSGGERERPEEKPGKHDDEDEEDEGPDEARTKGGKDAQPKQQQAKQESAPALTQEAAKLALEQFAKLLSEHTAKTEQTAKKD